MRRGFKKKRVEFPKFQRELNITADPKTGRYDPDLLFAFWKRSPLWELWKKEGITKDDPSLIYALNYPEYILRDFRRWWLAQTDAEFYIRVPWTDFDDWLKKNGFTGKVDQNYMKRFINAKEPVTSGMPRAASTLLHGGGIQPQPRNCEVFGGDGQHHDGGDGICDLHG